MTFHSEEDPTNPLLINYNIKQQPKQKHRHIGRKHNNPRDLFLFVGVEMNAVRQRDPVDNLKEVEGFEGIDVLFANFIVIKKVHQGKRIKCPDVVKVGVGLDKQEPPDFYYFREEEDKL